MPAECGLLLSNATSALTLAGIGAAASAPPLVFLHGIGLGLAPYLGFLSRMAAAADASPEGGRRTLVAVQYRHVSMRLSRRIPTAVEVARDVEAFLLKAGITQACVVAHSYGTLVASALTKRINAAAAAGTMTVSLAGLTLLDPVAFCMFLPHTLRAAIFFDHTSPTASKGEGARQATSAASNSPVPSPQATSRKGRTLLSYLSLRSLLKGIVVRDAHCAAALMRGGHWSEVNLWPSELPHNTSVILSGSDHLVPVEAVVTQLKNAPTAAAKGVTVQVHEGRGHGAFVLDPAIQAGILSLASIGFDTSTAAAPVAATPVPAQQLTATAPVWTPTAAAATVLAAASNRGHMSVSNLLTFSQELAAVKVQYLAVAMAMLAGMQASAGSSSQSTFPWLMCAMPQQLYLAVLVALTTSGPSPQAAAVQVGYQDGVRTPRATYVRSSGSTPRTQRHHLDPLSSLCPQPCTPRGSARSTLPPCTPGCPRLSWLSKSYTFCKPFHLGLT
jgi:pimeloyl-ACP methyl ester carboxylesterase